MVAILNALQPLEGVSAWLLEGANRQTDRDYAEYLRDCASCNRTERAV